jgi:cyclase
VRSGTADAARDAVEWAREAESRGAGEILLTSMDRDGTLSGFDCEMTPPSGERGEHSRHRVGGAGTVRALLRGVHSGDARRRAAPRPSSTSGSVRVSDLKQYLRAREFRSVSDAYSLD